MKRQQKTKRARAESQARVDGRLQSGAPILIVSCGAPRLIESMRNRKRLRCRLALCNLIVAGSAVPVFALSSPTGRADVEGKKEPAIGWQKDVSKVEIPRRPAAGMVRGHQFKWENATLGAGLLSLRQGQKFFADGEFLIFTFLGEESLEEVSYRSEQGIWIAAHSRQRDAWGCSSSQGGSIYRKVGNELGVRDGYRGGDSGQNLPLCPG